MYNAIVLSAGKGTRMKSEMPKGSAEVLGKSMIVYVIEALKKADIKNINVVVGYKKEVIIDLASKFDVTFSEQKELNGTAKAVESCKEVLENEDGTTIILPVDMPLVSVRLIESLFKYHEESKDDLTVLSTVVDNPFSYGRIIRDKNNDFLSIKEELDTTEEEKKIDEVNSSVYAVNNKLLFKALAKVNNNNKKNEYYLTDIVSILKNDGYKVGAYVYDDPIETIGINDTDTLSMVEDILKKRLNDTR